MTDLSFVDGQITTNIDLRSYRLTAVKKASYRMSERCTAMLGAPDGNSLAVTFTFKSGVTEKSALESVRAFFQELLDQELREQVAEETGPMRTLILAHAFSKTDLIRRQ